MSDEELRNFFLSLRNRKTLLFAIGNEFRHDDGVGCYIAKNLTALPENFFLINAMIRPENFVDESIDMKPETLIFIDSADYNGYYGEIRLLDHNSIPDKSLSTHNYPIKVFSEIISEETKCNVFYIGIQAKDMSFGEGMSAEVLESARRIIGILKGLNV